MSATATAASNPRLASNGPDAILQTAFGFAAAKTLLSAVELGLFSELEGGPAREEEIRGRLGLHPRGTRDFLDALVSMKLLERQDGHYANTPEASRYLDRSKPTYIGGILEMVNARLYKCWGSLTEALRTGEHQNEAKGGENLFEALYSDPGRLRSFAGAMTGLSLASAQALAAKFPWHKYHSVADVGTAQGCVPVEIARVHPHLQAYGFDLPALRPIFEQYVAGKGLSDRVRFIEGDFFNGHMPTAQVLIMGHILHDWGIADKMRLLRKAYDALPQGGVLIVYETMIDDERRSNTQGLLMSLNMLIETPAGFDYTSADCRRWMGATGFRSTYVEHLAGPESMVIGMK